MGNSSIDVSKKENNVRKGRKERHEKKEKKSGVITKERYGNTRTRSLREPTKDQDKCVENGDMRRNV
jgi:hypothetical protein